MKRDLPMSKLRHVVLDESPAEAGWYAAYICWCPEENEGIFPEGIEWSGQQWLTDSPIVSFWPVRHADQQSALEYARRNEYD